MYLINKEKKFPVRLIRMKMDFYFVKIITMKKQTSLLLSALTIFMLSSCEVSKRLYTKGFHVETRSTKKSAQNTSPATEVAVNSTIEKKQAAAPLSDFNDVAILPVEGLVSANHADKNHTQQAKAYASAQKEIMAEKSQALSSAKAKSNQIVSVSKQKVQAQKMAKSGFMRDGQSQLVALLLCFFLGYLGIHRFYLGYMGIGIIQLLTGGGCGIWALIDFIRIIIGDLGPRDGDYGSRI